MVRPADYSLLVTGAAPPGYPGVGGQDSFVEVCAGDDFPTRRRRLLEHLTATPSPPYMKAPYHELARLASGGITHRGVWEAALDFIRARRDCADFVIHAVLRWQLQFARHPGLADLDDEAWRTILDFKFWPDEPGSDSMCSWTENHQILFASAAYVAGQARPDAVFTNSGRRGRELVEIHRGRIERWLDLRFRTGFSEWLSHVYYDEDITALLALIDFATDADLRRRASMVLDLLLLDIALNQHRGVFGSTHGRSYERAKKWAREECTSDVQKLLFGCGAYGGGDSMSAVGLALSPRYRMPQVLHAIANDANPLVNRQRMGICIAEAARWGLSFDDLEDGMTFLSLEAYNHPRTVDLVMRLFDQHGWWSNDFFAPFAARRGWIEKARRWRALPFLARLGERDLTRNTREEVNLYTYRTADYMLSSAQDYRAGYGGDQQHVWQATLGPDAVCFTTHPARPRDALSYVSPGYWTGSGSLPRVAQIENVIIAIYDISTRPGLYLTNRLLFTHAWLPRDRFDETIEQAGWIFARRGNGYLALRSQRPYRWQSRPGEDCGREVIAAGKRNVWICELGRAEDDGSFARFVARITRAPLLWRRRGVQYDSPRLGRLEWAWQGPLRRNGLAVRLDDYPRYDNRFVQASFPSTTVAVQHGSEHLHLDWHGGRRSASAFVTAVADEAIERDDISHA